MDIKEINLGSIDYSLGKDVITTSVAMGKEDYEALDKLRKMGIKFDVRKVPTDKGENFDNMMKKAKEQLYYEGFMSTMQIILIFLIAFLAGTEGVLDQFQFHQPTVSCTLIGLVTGHLKEGVILGGSLQLITLGWANVGAAIAPDVALAGVSAAIIMVLGLQSGDVSNVNTAINTSIFIAVPIAIAGLFLTMIVRTISISLVHGMDRAAETGNFKAIDGLSILAVTLQGLRIAIPALIICLISPEVVTNALNSMPKWLTEGMVIGGGGMVAAVGYAMVINLMETKETWPFFALGFAISALSELTLIALGVIGISLALIYTTLKNASKNNNSGNGGSGDPLGDILNDY